MRTIHSHPLSYHPLGIPPRPIDPPLIAEFVRASGPCGRGAPAAADRAGRMPSNRFAGDRQDVAAARVIFAVSPGVGPVSCTFLAHYEASPELVTVASTVVRRKVRAAPAASAGRTNAPEKPSAPSDPGNLPDRRPPRNHRDDRPCEGDDEIVLEQLRQTQDYLRSRSARSAAAEPSRQCWEAFYARYDPLVRRTVEAWRMPRADAEDCIQEIWTEIVGKLSKLDFDPRRGRLRSWLYTLVRRKMIRHLRRRKREAPRSTTDPATLDGGPGADPSLVCLRRENRELVHRTLEELRRRVSEQNYRVVHLRWIDGRGAAEIAGEVDLTQEQVRYRLRRMKRKLRGLLAMQDNFVEKERHARSCPGQ
jgi:RNA polymerase sigma-70 factor (ECF subfamily)